MLVYDSGGPRTYTDCAKAQYVIMADLNNSVNIWWKDSNSSNETPEHPINEWTKTNVTIENIFPSTSIGYVDYLVYQGSDGFIRGLNVSWATENTTLFTLDGGAPDMFKTPTPGVPGTQFAITALAEEGGNASLAIFFQVEGDDMTQWSRNLGGGAWTSVPLPIGS